MVDKLPKDCNGIAKGVFYVMDRPGDKSNGCGRVISDLEQFSWEEAS